LTSKVFFCYNAPKFLFDYPSPRPSPAGGEGKSVKPLQRGERGKGLIL
jgi:hypothetical protein